MVIKEVIEILDTLPAKVGNDEEIESVIADLTTIKEKLVVVETEFDTLENDVSRLNIKNRELLQANNNLYRQIGNQQEAMKKAQEATTTVEEINAIF